MINQWMAIIGVLVASVGSYATAKLAVKAQNKKNEAEKEVSAGQLALDIATRLDRELGETRESLDKLQIWKRRIYQMWRKHELWDEAVIAELPPGAAERLPERPTLPTD